MSPETRGRPPGKHTQISTVEGREGRRRIFTDALANRIYGLTQRYPGSTLLADLRLAPHGARWQDFETSGFSYVTYPPDNWGPFYLPRKKNFGLNKTERKNVSTALKIAMETGFGTIQQIRDASVELLQEGLPEGGLPVEFRKTYLTTEKAAFLKLAFGPEVPQE